MITLMKSARIAVITVLLLMGLHAQPILAQVTETTGPYNLLILTRIVGSDCYPSGTIHFVVDFTNVGTNISSFVESIDTTVLTLPWKTYVATGLPVVFYPGQNFAVVFNVTIPEDQKPGNVSFVLTSNWRYWTGTAWSTGRAITYESWFIVLPNPYVLRDQVASLQSNISSLVITITLQNATITLQKATITLQNATIEASKQTIASLQSNVSSLTQIVASQNTTITSLNISLTAAEQTINSLRGQVSGLTATVASQNQTINTQNSQISQLQTTVTSQTNTIGSLQGQVSSLQADLNTTRMEMYVLIITTVFFLATTAFFAKRKPKVAEAGR